MIFHPREPIDRVELLQRYESVCQTHRAALRKVLLYVAVSVYSVIFLIVYYWILLTS